MRRIEEILLGLHSPAIARPCDRPAPTPSIVQLLREKIVDNHDRLNRLEARISLEEINA